MFKVGKALVDCFITSGKRLFTVWASKLVLSGVLSELFWPGVGEIDAEFLEFDAEEFATGLVGEGMGDGERICDSWVEFATLFCTGLAGVGESL